MSKITRRNFVLSSAAGMSGALLISNSHAQNANAPDKNITATGAEDRQYWLNVLDRLARPVLTALSQRRLKQTWKVQSGGHEDRTRFASLEALGRLLTGIAPWLENTTISGPEGKLREEFATLARQAIDAGTDPASPDYMNFIAGDQPVVDAAFLAHALLRSPNELWHKLDANVQRHVVAALMATRAIKPHESNWLLFSGMIEAFLLSVDEKWIPETIDHALVKHEEWYKGDGTYGDGPFFRWDYYNSFVIAPMLIDILGAAASQKPAWKAMQDRVLPRARRYAAVQERQISPEGTFPPIGRSLAYRFGAFQLLGQIALRRELPKPLQPAQVRCALTVVIRRLIEAPGTFDEKGFLVIGFCGPQPGVAESYISTGSLYLCAAGLLPLGLPPSDDFWAAPAADWTARQFWSGKNIAIDHALPD